MQGPKVQLEVQLGAVNVFVTPRQLHAIIYLSNIFLEDNSAQQSKQRGGHDAADDLESGSQYKQFNAMSGNLGFNQGWSSDPICKYHFVPFAHHSTFYLFIRFCRRPAQSDVGENVGSRYEQRESIDDKFGDEFWQRLHANINTKPTAGDHRSRSKCRHSTTEHSGRVLCNCFTPRSKPLSAESERDNI